MQPVPAASGSSPPPSSERVFARWRRWWRTWWQDRHPRSDTLLLTQSNIYILPTRAGWMFGITLLTLLIASINYQLNLGYVLTFLLAGSGAVSIYLTHNTLRGLTLRLRPPLPVFAGDAALLDTTLTSPERARYGIGLRMALSPSHQISWTDVPQGGQAQAQISFTADRRGLLGVPVIHAETRFPLGLFRAWTVWRPAASVLVYPRPETPVPAMPPAHAAPGGATARRSAEGSDVEGVRTYRRGDSLKLVMWKKAARTLAAGGELVSRDTSASVQQQLWLDWHHCGGLAPEDRLSRLAAWVLAADRSHAAYGLRLPGTELPVDSGDGHRKRCLEVLARWN